MRKAKTILPYWGLVPVAGAFALLLRLPSDAAEGARQGLLLCAQAVVPSLLPFLILSSLAAALGLPALLARAARPLLARLGLPPVCAAPLLLGLCGGYPVGAAAVAGLVRSGDLTPEEASRVLPVCNNTGPGFIVGFAGAGVFGSVGAGLALYLCHVLAALILALPGGKRRRADAPAREIAPPRRLPEVLPECVTNAAAQMLSICAYVVFFSVLTALLRAAGVLSALSAAVHQVTGMELRCAYALCGGLLELSQGVGALRGCAPTPKTAALCAFLLGFGGLSVHCQTLYAVSGTNIKCARHFAGRILHGLLSALFAYVLFTLPQI